MKCEWKEVALESLITDIAAGPFGSNLKVSCFVQTGFPIVDGANLKGFKVTDNITKFVTEEKARSLSRSIAKQNDVVVTISGTLGQIAYIPTTSSYPEYLCSQRQFRVTFDSQKVYVPYIVYYFHTYEGQNKILCFANQTGVPALSQPLKNFKKIKVNLPCLQEQKKIASIVERLDDKIELNNAINNNLEQQAQALFKSWFIDFEPFDNRIPSDWEKGKLKDIVQLKRQPIKAGSNTTLPYLPIDVIPMNTFAVNEFKSNEEAKSSLITFDKDDIIIGAMRVYFHRVVIAPCKGITRTTCFTLSPFQRDYLSFALLYCNQDSSIDYAQSTSKGSTMPYAIWDGGLGDMEIIIPSPQIAKEFNELVLPMIRQIQNSYFENNSLRELRDSLLPRLMSGELDVSDIDL